MSKKKINEPLIRQIIAQIEDTPEHWDQGNWVQHNCNTKFCFAGWALFLTDHLDGSGAPTEKGMKLAAKVDPDFVVQVSPWVYQSSDNVKWQYPYDVAAREVLGLGWNIAEQLFSPYAALPDMWTVESSDDIEIFKNKIKTLTGIDVNDGAYEIKRIEP